MPFNNPIVAGDTLIRNAIQSENFSTVEPGTGWQINRDGSATFNNLNTRGNAIGPSAAYDQIAANTSLLYKGTELQTLLDQRQRGIVAYAIGSAQLYTTTGAPEIPILEIVYVGAVAAKTYRVVLTPVRVSGSPATENCVLTFRFTGDGSQPGITSTICGNANTRTSVANNEYSSLGAEGLLSGVTGTLRVLLTMKPEFGNTATINFSGIEMYIEEAGPIVANTGVNRYTGAPNKVYKTFDYTPYASRDYRANGTNLGYDNVYCHQGDIGVDGNRRSWITWDGNAPGQPGSPANMIGIAAADVSYLDVYLYYPHWYFTSGGTCFIGHHNNNTPAATEPGGGIYGEVAASWPGRNVGQWVSLKGTAIENAIRAGTFQGIILGNTGSASLNHYGYAYGANGVNGQQPGLRAGYYK